MDVYVKRGNIGKVLDLVDEHGNTCDKMFYAIADCNTDRILELEALGIDITQEHYIKSAVRHDKLLVIVYQVSKGANVDTVIQYAEEMEKQTIWQWGKSWKTAHSISNGGSHG